jgi:hypothetical protein
MPAWTPDESFGAFDESGELREDLPQDLADFFVANDVAKNFTVEVLKYDDSTFSGLPVGCGECINIIPTKDAVVKQSGTGYYAYKVSWKGKRKAGENQLYKFILMGDYYEKMYEEAKEKREEGNLKHEESKAKKDAIRFKYGLPTSNGKKGDEFADFFSKMKTVNEVIGKPGGGDTGAIVGLMGTMMMGVMQMMMKASENSTNMLIAMMNKNGDSGSHMRETLDVLRETLTLRDGLMPKDKNVVEDLVGAVAENADLIFDLFKKPKAEREADPRNREFKKGMSKTRERVQDDPDFLRGLVLHMDKKCGSDLTDKILEGYLNVNRPAPKGKAKAKTAAPKKEATPPDSEPENAEAEDAEVVEEEA